MSEETKTVITAALLIFAAAAWIWPLASVMAGIVSYYVCAFLDRYRKDR